ncbi:unnamed protein product [Rhodiola kirilowii]
MDTSLSIAENLDIFLKMTLDLDRCKDKIADTHQAVILLNSLPSQFENLKDVIQYGRDELTLNKIIESVVQKNDSLKVFKRPGAKGDARTDSKNEVMFSKGKPKYKNSFKKSRKLESQNKQSDGKSENRTFNVKRFYCNQMGHFASDCQKKKNNEANNNNRSKGKNAREN